MEAFTHDASEFVVVRERHEPNAPIGQQQGCVSASPTLLSKQQLLKLRAEVLLLPGVPLKLGNQRDTPSGAIKPDRV
jgi:hypothetical protein